MPFLDDVLEVPSYGWKDKEGLLVVPSTKQLFNEFFSRLNVFKSRKNWLPFFAWSRAILLSVFFILFLCEYLNWTNFVIAFIYGMILMGTHGTIWHHRYCTHGAYVFRNKFWRFVTQNLTISVIPEEIYAISHHVHHSKSDKPGDPYNAEGGFLYCFLADVNHQPIAKNLSREHYRRVVTLMEHTGVSGNTYEEYQKWGSYAKPWNSILLWLLNWSVWYAIFFFIGGNSLAVTIFGAAGFWAIGVRTYNYEGHGKGKDKQKDGVDYNHNDKSINQLWPGIVAGEWHNNHHLFPRSARSGFKPLQVDLAWYYIKTMYTLGAIVQYRDNKKQFYQKYYLPYLKEKKEAKLRAKAMSLELKRIAE